MGEEVGVCEDGEGGDRREFGRRSGCVWGGGFCGAVKGGDRDVCGAVLLMLNSIS